MICGKRVKENIIQNQNKKLDNLKRSALLSNTKTVRKNIPFLVTYSPTLPNIKKIVNKLWDLLNINCTFADVYKTISAIALCKNTSLRPLIGADTIRNNQELLNVKRNATKETCSS